MLYYGDIHPQKLNAKGKVKVKIVPYYSILGSITVKLQVTTTVVHPLHFLMREKVFIELKNKC